MIVATRQPGQAVSDSRASIILDAILNLTRSQFFAQKRSDWPPIASLGRSSQNEAMQFMSAPLKSRSEYSTTIKPAFNVIAIHDGFVAGVRA